MGKIVLITGATSGFGEACAHKFAKNGYAVILNGRRKERLDALQKQLAQQYNSESFLLPFDVRNKEEVFESVNNLPPEWKKIDVLINNAGLALGRDLINEGNIEDWDTMIDTNVKGLLYVSKAILPFMVERKTGHIINIGSTAAKEVYEKGNVYCASKSAVEAITKGMRIDLLPYNIKVTAIHPGAAETEFSLVRFKGNNSIAKKVYEGYKALTPQEVADIVFYTTTLPPHVCINDLVVTATQQANSIYFNKNQ